MASKKTDEELRAQLEAEFDAGERNAIEQIICRVHPDGGDACWDFWEWYKPQAARWLGPSRAAGAWLYERLVALGVIDGGSDD